MSGLQSVVHLFGGHRFVDWQVGYAASKTGCCKLCTDGHVLFKMCTYRYEDRRVIGNENHSCNECDLWARAPKECYLWNHTQFLLCCTLCAIKKLTYEMWRNRNDFGPRQVVHSFQKRFHYYDMLKASDQSYIDSTLINHFKQQAMMKRNKHVFQMNTHELEHELKKRNINRRFSGRSGGEYYLRNFIEKEYFCVKQQESDNKLLAACWTRKLGDQHSIRMPKVSSDLIATFTGTWLLTRTGFDSNYPQGEAMKCT